MVGSRRSRLREEFGAKVLSSEELEKNLNSMFFP